MAREYPKDSTVLDLAVSQSKGSSLPTQIWPLNINLLADPYDPYGAETRDLPESTVDKDNLSVVDIPVPGSGWSVSSVANWNPPDVDEEEQVADPSLIPLLFLPLRQDRIHISSGSGSGSTAQIQQISLGTGTSQVSITGSVATTTPTTTTQTIVTQNTYVTDNPDPDLPDPPNPPIDIPDGVDRILVTEYRNLGIYKDFPEGFSYTPTEPYHSVACCGGFGWTYYDGSLCDETSVPVLAIPSRSVECASCDLDPENTHPPCSSFFGVDVITYEVPYSMGVATYEIKQPVHIFYYTGLCALCGCYKKFKFYLGEKPQPIQPDPPEPEPEPPLVPDDPLGPPVILV